MGLFSFLSQEIAIDLGTANTIIIQNDKVVVDEPSVVALDAHTSETVAIGNQARPMMGRVHPGIRVVRPMKDGVIADFKCAEIMIREMIKMMEKKNHFFSPSLKIVVCIPSGCTEVELRAVRDSAENAGGREVYMIHEPMAAAIGIGLDVEAAQGNMIVDIGGGTTEIAVIALGGIVCDKSIKVAGDVFTSKIQEFIRSEFNIKIGERTAEEIKMSVGAAIPDLANPPAEYTVCGPHMVNAIPCEQVITHAAIAACLDEPLTQIENAVQSALENTPPELYSDIVSNGIWLTGGGALLRGLAERLQRRTGIRFKVAEDPLHSVAHGTGIALKNIDKFQFLIR
ncbi:MAG: rod shape-determining protein [Bacteroidales bacterium]|jgi:rod shape-determining protein MreB|nr:rod shape-determining protein [Bacteroidales bacterium]